MKNLTITLDDELFAWARGEAAKRGQSLSRFVSHALADRRAPDLHDQMEALGTFLDGPGWPGVSVSAPKREDLYDRPALLRHESAGLRDGPEGAGQAGKLR